MMYRSRIVVTATCHESSAARSATRGTEGEGSLRLVRALERLGHNRLEPVLLVQLADQLVSLHLHGIALVLQQCWTSVSASEGRQKRQRTVMISCVLPTCVNRPGMV